MNLEIRNYQQGDEKEIIQLFELVFKQKMSMDQWNWRFKNNPMGSEMIKLAWDGDVLAGHYAVSPLNFIIKDEIVKGAHSLTTMTHPSYGGKGIFKTLSLGLYQEIEIERGVNLTWGFPNNNSHYGFIKSLGWKDIGLLSVLACPIANWNKTNQLEANVIQHFDISHSALLESGNSNLSISLLKSQEYLNWRYFNKPSVNYSSIEIRQNNDLVGFIVTKIYPINAEKTVWDLNIMELVSKEASLYATLISSSIEQYSENLNRITLWKNIHSDEYRHFELLGFTPSQPLTYMSARINEKYLHLAGDLRNWNYSLGDSDVY